MTDVRVLVVDDSVVVRRMLVSALDGVPGVEVVGTAPNGQLALAKLDLVDPDVVTLDVEMPVMDGLATLKELRARRPQLPVIMFSTLTERGASTTLEALSLGASDYVTKPTAMGSVEAAIDHVRAELGPRVLELARHRRHRTPAGSRSAPLSAVAPDTPAPPRLRPGSGAPIAAIGIGTSTGGPTALEALLCALAPDLPVPILVVQHMPPVFTRQMADRLDQRAALRVIEASDGSDVVAGTVYVAPGGIHMTVEREGSQTRIRLVDDPPEHSCRPAVDVLFRSMAECFGRSVLAVVMTGMGRDGHAGARTLVDRGSEVIAQDEETSVVWGMPGYVARDGLATAVLPLERLAPVIERRVHARARTSTSGDERKVPPCPSMSTS